MIKKLIPVIAIAVAFSFRSAPVKPLLSTNNYVSHRAGPVVDFKLKDVKGRYVSLSDFRGKFVVIDFWASWCVPCREEMPAVEKLANSFGDNDKVVFLYISFDQEEADWKNAVKKNDVDGIQLIAGDKNEDLKTMFNMDEIPHFAWINSKGEIVKKDAPRPSEFGTKATLQAYIAADN